jgi:diacylglycerol kinase family enzyme
MPTFELMKVFPKIYAGKHITHPKVKVKRAKTVRIVSPNGHKIGMDLDGEPSDGASDISYEIIPKTLKMLL